MKKQVEKYFCDFCGKSQDEVSVIVSGKDGAAICDNCIDRAMAIVNESREKARLAKDSNPDSD